MQILNWSEFWALLLPLYFIITSKKPQSELLPIKTYIFLAFIISLGIDLIANQKQLNIDLPWHNNVFLYNLHSVVRFFCFSWFFINMKPTFLPAFKFTIAAMFLLFLAGNFSLNESIFEFSGLTLGIEVMLLLIYCLIFYFQISSQEEFSNIKSLPTFWIVTGLSIYIAICFMIFLFYDELSLTAIQFAINIWNVHNIAFIILCCFLAIGFYKSDKYNKPNIVLPAPS